MTAHVHCLLVHRFGLWWLGIRSEIRHPHIGVYLTRAAGLRAVERYLEKGTRERFPKRAPNGMLLSSHRKPPIVGPKGPSGTINVRPRRQQPVARRIEPQVRATPPQPPKGGSGISRPRG